MPGAIYRGQEYLGGGFGCVAYDAKGQKLGLIQMTDDEVHDHTRNGVLEIQIRPTTPMIREP